MASQHEIPIKSIRLDGGTQSRVKLDVAVVNIYAEQMEAESAFPPIDVYFDGQDYWLADGWHRLEAATKLGFVHIGALVHEGSQRDAVWHSLKANKNHGLQRSDEDKRRAVTTVLEDQEWSQWSDRHISRELGVSPTLVGEIRKGLTVHVDSSEGGSGQRKYVRQGKTHTMKTNDIGKVDTKPVNVIEYNHMGYQAYKIDIDAEAAKRAKAGRSWEPIYEAIEDHVNGEESALVFARYDGGYPNYVFVACRESAVHAGTANERGMETDIMLAVDFHPVITFSDFEFHTEGALRRIIDAGHVVIVFDANKTLGNLDTVKAALERQHKVLEHIRLEEERRSEEGQAAVRRGNSLIEHPDPAAAAEAARAAIMGETSLSREGHPIPGLPTNGSHSDPASGAASTADAPASDRADIDRLMIKRLQSDNLKLLQDKNALNEQIDDLTAQPATLEAQLTGTPLGIPTDADPLREHLLRSLWYLDQGMASLAADRSLEQHDNLILKYCDDQSVRTTMQHYQIIERLLADDTIEVVREIAQNADQPKQAVEKALFEINKQEARGRAR